MDDEENQPKLIDDDQETTPLTAAGAAADGDGDQEVKPNEVSADLNETGEKTKDAMAQEHIDVGQPVAPPQE
jgi:hypothetical protein